MKKSIFTIIIIFAAMLGFNTAQAQQPAAQQQTVIIKPTMLIDYLVFATNALQTIEIQGSEVDAFLLCQQTLNNEIQNCVNQKKTVKDQTTFEIRVDVAQTLISFLGRAKLTGADAVKYKGFITALNTAAENYQKQNKK